MVIIYHLLAAIDSILFGLASEMFGIIYDIATTDFFKSEQILDVANRVYVVVGVLMLFKLVIAAIQYMINPDTFDDKEKGMGGLLQKLVVSLLLIVIVPSVFNFLISIQKPIIRTLPSIILGNNASELTSNDSIGFDLSFQVLQAFVKARDGKGGSVGENGEIHDIGSFNIHITDGCPLLSIFGLFSTDSCKYDYMIIVSTLGGAFLCYVLLSMILDVAIRTIKFGIIQMLAPIPISSYVFSKDKLNKFVKTSLTVYTDLFIRMAIVYFVIFAIREMVIKNNLLNVLSINGGGVSDTGNWFRGVIVNVSIIFGLLMFASKAPKFLTELLGLPDVGSGDMADMFKPAWQRVGGSASLGASIGAWRNAKDYGEPPKRRLMRALTAGAHATGARLRDIASGKSLEESYKTARDAAFARTNKNLEYANRYKNRKERMRQRRHEMWDSYTGVTTGGERANANIAAANSTIEMRTHAWDRANAKTIEHRDRYGTTLTTTYVDASGNTQTKTLTWAEVERRYKALNEGGETEAFAGEFNWLEENIQDMRDAASREYIRQAFADYENGDNKTRNVFSEDILKIIRSGADAALCEEICNQKVKGVRVVKLNSNGAEMKGPDGRPIYEIDSTTGQPVTKELNIDLGAMAQKVQDGVPITLQEAEILSMIIPKMDKIGGNIRLRETSTQTSVPKSSS